jgi:hypothetical protein
MIGWQNLAAFWMLPIAAVPIVIHLLQRRRATRIAFPSLRFVAASQTAAVRLRRPSDAALMMVRAGVLAMAIAALAGPVLVTDARLAAWNASTARALVVDTSDSMRSAEADGADAARRADSASDVERHAATHSRRFDAADLGEGMARAAAWLAATPPARKELVIISDFQDGVLDDTVLSRLPTGIGLRFVEVGVSAGTKRVPAGDLLGAGAVPPRTQTMSVAPEGTDVIAERRPEAPIAGVRLMPPHAAPVVLGIAARAGAVNPSRDEPLAIRFQDGDPLGAESLSPVRAAWMAGTVLRLGSHLATTGADMDRGVLTVSPPWAAVARDREGRPVVAAAARGDELVIDVAARSDSLFAAVVARAALNARRSPDVYAEHEVARTPPATLKALTRPAAMVGPDDWRHAEATDARWCWLLAIVGLLVEQWLRRDRREGVSREVARAA